MRLGLEALLLQLQPGRLVRENISTNDLSFPMSDPSATVEVPVNTSAGHLCLHFEGDHPVAVPFLFEQPEKRIGPAALASFAYHIVMVAVLLWAIRYTANRTTEAAVLPEHPNSGIIWLNQLGPGGGGGGGGNRMKEPPRKAELPGKDKLTVPVVGCSGRTAASVVRFAV